ncbi:MAG TPA: MupA/Atu3671 family FMN-dependent luciferase-like monooxygenase [Myxococcaceae bacterium]|jgi:natural product biosynthesis luciferase-like monooxygenase protein/amino acid adenylation domain-containing protein/non-ribosomal peptide synthase protein (TIGR01720 family)
MTEAEQRTGNEIAIVGMAGRFPGARDLPAFWRNLREGVESIARFAPEELEPSPFVPPEARSHPDFVLAGGVLEDAEAFDHGFFDMSLREAGWMDPQQRVFLETAWAALEDAGCDPHSYPGRISLYAGAGQSGHLLEVLRHVPREPAALFEALGANTAENVAMRVSHKLRLRGESLSVHTACSTGLVTVHMACQSLLLHQSDLALAGAVKVAVPQRTGYLYQEGMIFSPDGRCRAFDARARGTVSGSGAGVVVLKRLDEAVGDGDHVYAVIKGSAVNNDGGRKVGYTAPSVEGQADAIGQALAFGEVSADDVGYVEAHGTGTVLGDPIEIAALTRAFRQTTQRSQFCAVGSVKTNIGHLDTAAGIAGLIKAALALHHGEIPSSLHFERPNPGLELDSSPFFVNRELREWRRGPKPRRAGVSSFGIGGTNAHAVLEEAPARTSGPSLRARRLVTLSARTLPALDALTRELAEHLESHPEVALADVAFSRSLGRRAFEHRRAFVAGSREELLEALRHPPAATHVPDVEVARGQRVAFLFPGQGAQSAGMARELHETEPVFRRELDRLHPAAIAGQDLSSPAAALPALFAVEHALARLWMSWGIAPYALLGHSFGEYVAACLAGVLSPEEGLALAAARGRLMARMPPGRMLAVGLAEDEVRPLLSGALAIAAVNGAERCVVSGPEEEIAELERRWSARRVGLLPLPARHAFHSRAVEPLMPEMREAVARLRLRPPERPYVSSLTGTWIRAEEATDPDYWVRQMREPVRFAAGLDALRAGGCTAFVEVGPDQGLTALCRQHFPRGPGTPVAVPSLRRRDVAGSDLPEILKSLGELWRAGLAVEWPALFAGERRLHVPLPTYPFQRSPCRLGPPLAEAPPVAVPAPVPAPAPVRALATSEIERRVADIWKERLELPEIDIHTSFLELGGNSLMAAQMLTRLRTAFPVQIPLSDLFEAPTVAGVAARIEARLASSQVVGDGPAPSRILPIARGDEPLPLSCVQTRVLELERLDPGNPALNMPFALRLVGPLRPDVLERSIGEVVRRHEALRAVYAYSERSGSHEQRIEPSPRVPLKTIDLGALGDAAGAEALRIAREEAALPFDLARGPVLRSTLLRLKDGEHVLLLTLHHVVSDTGSMVVLAQEVGAAYAALALDRASPLSPLPVQYADFAAWQRRALAGGELERQLAHWKARLEAPPPALSLPADRPPPSRPGLRSLRRAFSLPARLSEAVKELGRREGATPFMVLLAAYGALLHRYTDQDDLAVGTPIGNRSRPELEPLIGYVAHAVPLRLDLSGDPSFRELVSRTRGEVLTAYAHPDVPYEHLVPAFRPEAARSRLFDAAFVLHEGIAPTLELPDTGLSLGLLDVPDLPAQFGTTLSPLTIFLNEGPGGFTGALEHDADRFEPATISRFLEHLHALVAGAVADPALRLSELPLELHPAEPARGTRPSRSPARPSLEFSLSYFANDEDRAGDDKYALLLEGARFADAHGFSAVWTPERHFHSFGGLYPSPAAIGGALATATRRIGLRAGSVVLPLHDPVLVAEEWAVIDNLSRGRVGVSFASGWHASDFVLAPERYARRKELMLRGIETVRALWRGEPVRRKDGNGTEIEVRIRPRPVQEELPVWLTAAGSAETFRLAGQVGAGVLTNLMGQELDSLAGKIATYRAAWRSAGHRGHGHVSLMLHTFLGSDLRTVREAVRQPLLRYFRSSVDIFSTFAATQGLQVDAASLTEQDMQALLEHGLDRYLEVGGLFGGLEDGLRTVARLQRLGVDEVACLIDFGVDLAATLRSLEHLDALREKCAPPDLPPPAPEIAEPSSPRVVDALGRPVPIGVVGDLVDSAEGPGRALARARRRADGSIEKVQKPSAAPRKASPHRIARVSRSRELPLSFAQQRLWYLDQLEPGNAAYNNPAGLRMTGPLDAGALRRSLEEVVRRHEVLRTRFVTRDGRAAQEIEPSLEVPLPLEDLSALGGAERDAAARRRLTEEAARPFDLARGPLLRALLLRLGAREHFLLVTMHHIISDGWSAGVLLQELALLYGAYSTGRPAALPELEVQYADHAVWQREWMQGAALEAQLAYWRERLAGAPALELPADRPRPPVQTYRGARLPFAIPKRVMDRLAAVGRERGATPFMALMATLQALLHRYTGQEDISVGTPVAGRSRPEIEPLVGCFVNSVVVRTDLSGNPTYLELLDRVRGAALGAFSHQDAPFEKLVDALHASRDLSHTPLFQVMLVLHNTPAPRVELGELALDAMEVDNGTSKLDLTLELREVQGGLRGGIEYNTDLFDGPTVQRFAEHLGRLLEGVVEDPDRRLSDLPLMGEDERRSVIGSTPRRLPAEADTLHGLFEAQARRSPEAVALAAGGRTLTYRELEQRAHRLARRLRAEGVGPEARIGLLTDDPIDEVVSMLAVMQAGAAYVPLDPAAPPQRRAWMLEDAGIRRVIAAPDHAVPGDEGDAAVLELLPASGSGSAAYVLYTSGSTGRPKGVVVEHAQIVQSTLARMSVYGAERPRLICLSPFTFDAATGAIFWALCSGGTLCFPPRDLREDARGLAAFISASHASHLVAVPSLYAPLLAAADPGALSGLRSVLLGGEAFPDELLRHHAEALPGATLHNEYGPTEATVWSTVHACTAASPRPLPVGVAIPTAQVLVLDRHLQPVPIGATGELYVGGEGVARGYLDRPDLTAERFVPDPFGARPGARLYRTGDLGRRLPGGEIQLRGRTDQQVKIRGFRIEPGEIEAALGSHPAVREAAVIAREDVPGHKRLVAYVAAEAGPDLLPALAAHLRDRLPEYMVPTAWSVLEALPRTPNGKVARSALPAPERSAHAFVAARTGVEETLVEIWKQILNAGEVGIHDNFFELGGDSILAIQIVARAQQAGLSVAARDILLHPTIARLAAVAQATRGPEVEQGPVTGAAPLTPAQRWFFEADPVDPHHWNMSLLLESRTPLDPAALERALARVVEHHDALRLRFTREGDGWRQEIVPPGDPVPVSVEQVDPAELQAGLDLSNGPLVRCALLRPGAGPPERLLLVIHHLLVDAISWRVLLEDLALAYRGVALPPKTTSFLAWARGLEERARSEATRGELPHWLEQAWAKVAPLPATAGPGEERLARKVEAALSATETRQLLQEASRAYHTQIQELLLAALAQAFHRWTGAESVLVDVEGHGREDLVPGADISRTVGWFTTTYPVLLEHRAAEGAGEAIKRIKEHLRRIPGRGAGYGLLMHLGDDEARAQLRALPAAQVSFNYLGQVEELAAGPDLRILADGAAGPQRSPRGARRYLLEITGVVSAGELRTVWTYGEAAHPRSTIETLARDFIEALRSLIAHCLSPETGGHTVSDFPLAKVSQQQLDKLAARFNRKGR